MKIMKRSAQLYTIYNSVVVSLSCYLHTFICQSGRADVAMSIKLKSYSVQCVPLHPIV